MSGYVRSETHKGITSIEFFHPQSNSLPGKILHDLSVAIKHAGENPDTIVIILRSAGEKAFCAGASFDELMAIKNEKEGLQFFTGLDRKSTRLNSSHSQISYAVFCLK